MCFAAQGRNKYHCITGGGPCFIVHPSDFAVALLTLDAQVAIVSASDDEIRWIGLADLYVFPRRNLENETVLQPGEIITHVRVPALSVNTRSGYIKFKERGVRDFAVVSVAAVLNMAGNRVTSGRLTFGGVAPILWRDEALEGRLAGLTLDRSSSARFAKGAFSEVRLLTENAIKVPLVRRLLEQLLVRPR